MVFVLTLLIGSVALVTLGLPVVDALARFQLLPAEGTGGTERKRAAVPTTRLTPIDLGPDPIVWPSQRQGSAPYRDELDWPSHHWDDPGFGPPNKRKRAEEAGRVAAAGQAAAAEANAVASEEASRRPPPRQARPQEQHDPIAPATPVAAATPEPEPPAPEPDAPVEAVPQLRSLAAASAAMRAALAEARADVVGTLPPLPPAEISAAHARRAEDAASGTRRTLTEAERSLAMRKLRESSGSHSAPHQALPPPPPTDEEISQVLRAAAAADGRRRPRREREREREPHPTAPMPGRDEILAMIQARGLPQAMRHLMHTTGLTWEQVVELLARRR